jgi:hypothetical protein
MDAGLTELKRKRLGAYIAATHRQARAGPPEDQR